MVISLEKSNMIADTRRKQILDAALILFDKKGYSKTRVVDIAEAAGISKGLVYRYFPSKVEIFKAYVDPIQTCLDEVLNRSTPTASLRDFAIKLTADPYVSGYLPPMRVYIATFIRGELPPNMNENFIRTGFGRTHLAPVIREGQLRGEFKDGDPEDLADIFWYYLLGVMANILHNKDSKVILPDIDLVLSFLKE